MDIRTAETEEEILVTSHCFFPAAFEKTLEDLQEIFDLHR